MGVSAIVDVPIVIARVMEEIIREEIGFDGLLNSM